MRLGQKSIIVFFSKFSGAILGFAATLVFARVVGPAVLGIYGLILTITRWTTLASDFGVGNSLKKRISEAEEPGKYLTAGVIWVSVVSILVSLLLLLLHPFVEQYVSEFDQYSQYSVVWVLILLLFVRIFYKFPLWILNGERRVHIAALLDPIKQGSQSLFQIAFVVAGFSLLGMLAGYIIASIFIGLFALYYVSIGPSRPNRYHFQSLYNYAKFAWFGRIKSRVFNDIDILILGVFLPSSAIGIYTVAWSLSKFLEIFSNAISSTMFPEISHTSSQNSTQAVSNYVEDALAYTGLFVIPGLVGGFILSVDLMRIYGPDFVDGANVLWMLIFAILVYAYQKQLVNAVNGVDRPDLSFRVNLVFAIFNIGLNIWLIPVYGIEGAAIASIISVGISLGIAYYYLRNLLDFSVPTNEILRQMFAAVTMGFFIFIVRKIIIGHVQINVLVTPLVVSFGALVYFLVLLMISPRLRETVVRNLSI